MSKTKSAEQHKTLQTKVIIEDCHLVRVRTLEQNLKMNDELLRLPSPPKLTPVVDVTHKSLINKDSELINHTLSFRFKSNVHENDSEPLCIFELVLDFLFKVSGIKKYIINNDAVPTEILFELDATLLSIAFSTSRGIIMERTLSTPFRGILIPVIDVAKLLQASQANQP
jgi:hypothetical protein